MPIKPELNDFIIRAIEMLQAVHSSTHRAVSDLRAMLQLSDLATDETARSLIGRARGAVQAALDAFEATDFKTADISERPNP